MHDGPSPLPQAQPFEAADHDTWMARGTQLHAAGQIEQALFAFENALALAPQDVNTACACATLLSLLDRPQAAYRTLLAVEAQLMESADGAANLAIAAETCGDLPRAEAAYAQALRIDPEHVRSLNNVGILAASASQWALAIGLARKCLALQAGHAPHHANLAEFLAGDGRYPEALELISAARLQFRDDIDLKIRHTALLALSGDLDGCNTALAGMDTETRRLFDEFLAKPGAPRSLFVHAGVSPDRPAPASRDALDIHARHVFEKMSRCDWRGNDRFAGLVRQALAESAGQVHKGRHWQDATIYGLTLPLQESELRQMRCETIVAMRPGPNPGLPPFVARPRTPGTAAPDQRIRIGLAVQSLRNKRQLQALAQQLAGHDATRFAFFVYAFTQQPDPDLADTLRPHAQSVAELGHMLDAEAAARMRLDRLDVYVEAEGDFGWSRPAIAAWRVAPVQLRQRGWHQHHVSGHWDYTLSDRFIHPDPAPWGAIVRLPHSCWLASHAQALAGGADTSRADMGLPADALVLGTSVPPAMLDAESFAVWMKMLRSLPDAVLCLPGCARAADHLLREAQAAGVGASRLFFSAQADAEQTPALLKHADIFLDPLRCSLGTGLEDALRLGLPALSCAGPAMASRLGASMLQAAGLPQAVFDSKEAYVAGALRLGRDAAALQQLRAQLQEAVPVSALFDTAARIREWEAAWETMLERSRAGLAPAGFDVPSSHTTLPAALAAAQAL